MLFLSFPHFPIGLPMIPQFSYGFPCDFLIFLLVFPSHLPPPRPCCESPAPWALPWASPMRSPRAARRSRRSRTHHRETRRRRASPPRLGRLGVSGEAGEIGLNNFVDISIWYLDFVEGLGFMNQTYSKWWISDSDNQKELSKPRYGFHGGLSTNISLGNTIPGWIAQWSHELHQPPLGPQILR